MVLLNFQSNIWYQMTFTYTPTNFAIYTNGALVAIYYTPPTSNSVALWDEPAGILPSSVPLVQADGFSVGTFNDSGGHPIYGLIDELETFNYPLTAQAVAAGYPYFGGNPTNMLDTYYVGRSDMLQSYVDGVTPASTNIPVPCRLGYWRFDSPFLYTEEGQRPTSMNGVTTVSSWSGTALNVSSYPGSEVTYPDVGSNGWANINCRQGSLRFWFKPNSRYAYLGPVYLSWQSKPDKRRVVAQHYLPVPSRKPKSLHKHPFICATTSIGCVNRMVHLVFVFLQPVLPE